MLGRAQGGRTGGQERKRKGEVSPAGLLTLAAALTVGRVQVRSVGNDAALAVCIVPSAALFHSVFLFSFIWDEAVRSGHTPKWNL